MRAWRRRGRTLLILTALLAIVFLWFAFSHSRTSSSTITLNHSPIMTRQQFIKTSPGFSFDYPVFPNWEATAEPEQIVYTPVPDAGFSVPAPYVVTVREKMMKVSAGYWEAQPKNPHGVPYVINDPTSVTFRLASQGTSIEVVVPIARTDHGFSSQIVFDTIVRSFHLAT